MTLDELSAHVAELVEGMAALREQVAANAQIGTQITELLKVLREQPPARVEPRFDVPPAPAPVVRFEPVLAAQPRAWELRIPGPYGQDKVAYLRPIDEVPK